MFKALASLFRARPAAHSGRHATASPGGEPAEDEDAMPEGEMLALTDEMREALFPTRPQMVSAIFTRGTPSRYGTPPAERAPERSFPIV